MLQNIIGVICDCDGTLCSDTTELLLREYGIDPKRFYDEVERMVKKGWDPPLALMRKILKNNQLKNLKVKDLEDLGKKVDFYEGVPGFFEELRSNVVEKELPDEPEIKIEYYIISSGFEELIKASELNKHVNDIFGCAFYQNREGFIEFPKRTMTFTEKTRYLFAINKGLAKSVKNDPYELNALIKNEKRRIPFEHIIYIGDGPTDVPCFSIVKERKGFDIGLLKESRPFEKVIERREARWGPYRRKFKNSSLRDCLEEKVKIIGKKIKNKWNSSHKPPPTHGS